MGISLKPQHLRRYRDLAWFLIKYGRSDLVKTTGLDSALDAKETPLLDEGSADAGSLADDLEKMGPTFVKLGQLLSTRPDLVPIAYIESLTRLQDKVEPFSFADVERTVTAELGVRISKAFAEFEATPIAAASLGQVHKACLRDGRAVAVKVQRPGIQEQIIEDVEALEDVAEFLDRHTETGKRYQFQKILDEFRKSLLSELDYRQEARNLSALADNLSGFNKIVIPSPIDNYTTSRVLTMEYIRGRKITDLSPLIRMDVEGGQLADQLFAAYLKQILVDGLFHADPHPGNVFLTDDGRIALLDLGMVARVDPALQERLLQLLLAISDGRGDEAATQAIKIARGREEDFDELEFRRRISALVARYQDVELADVLVGRIVLEVVRTSAECGIRVPPQLTMLGKTLLNLDQVGRTLDPDFEPNAALRRNATEILRQRMMRSVSPGNVFSGLIEMKDFAERLPGRINRALDTVANNDLKLKVDAIDEHRLMEGLQKIANRITLGLVLAALIIGAAMLMSVPTTFRILGYPGLAILFFFAAAGGGVLLMLNILFHDEKASMR